MRATFNELAEAELNDVIAYYETEQVGLGAAFLEEARRLPSAWIVHVGRRQVQMPIGTVGG